MSHDSPTQLPEAPRASKAHKYDVYDANIRNFAPVARIMKLALPENAKIAKEAKECMQECVSEFISFITSEGEFSDQPTPTFHGLRLTINSLRKMPPREEKNSKWRGYIVCNDISGLRELRRGAENLFDEISRSKYFYHLVLVIAA